MGRILYLDCAAGASGDMVLGALLDLGLPLADLQTALAGVVPEDCRLSASRVLRSGISATKFDWVGADAPAAATHGHAHQHDHAHAHDHDHDHDHAHAHAHEATHPPGHTTPHGSQSTEHHHRGLREVLALIDRSDLSATVKAKASALFQRLAEVEAAIHQTPVDRVHFHEVGAIDSIVDIVGAVWAFDRIGVERIVSSPLNTGSGTVETQHGTLPVPAPATLRLLEGAPVYSSGIRHELVTPTGALLVTGHAQGFGPLPPCRILASGYGAGGRDLPGVANVLRAILGEEAGVTGLDRVSVLECNIDDMNPQFFGALMDRLYAAGALEVFFTAVQMKKNRPGTLVTIVGNPAHRATLTDIVYRETTTIGVRHFEMDRDCLARDWVPVTTPWGEVRIKVAVRDGAILKGAPEYDDCARLAAASGVAVKDVHAAAVKAFLDQGEGKGKA
jgi:pyridinium-3,5-bisthiocarboxylic acid mononucleotide nickel chelatase